MSKESWKGCKAKIKMWHLQFSTLYILISSVLMVVNVDDTYCDRRINVCDGTLQYSSIILHHFHQLVHSYEIWNSNELDTSIIFFFFIIIIFFIIKIITYIRRWNSKNRKTCLFIIIFRIVNDGNFKTFSIF